MGCKSGTKWYKPLYCVARTTNTMMQVMICCRDLYRWLLVFDPPFLVASGGGWEMSGKDH